MKTNVHHTKKGLPPIQDRITKAKRGYWLRNPKQGKEIFLAQNRESAVNAFERKAPDDWHLTGWHTEYSYGESADGGNAWENLALDPATMTE